MAYHDDQDEEKELNPVEEPEEVSDEDEDAVEDSPVEEPEEEKDF